MKYKHKALNLTFFPLFLRGASKDTEATNETNERIARETNEANIAMNRDNNELQIRLQQEMNDYNSVVQQLERAKQAGVNPNAVISGSLNGNLQNSLPSTQAGHADPWRVENPYMEKLGTIDQLRGIFSDFFQNSQLSAQTELTKNQAQAQYTENQYLDDLRGLQVSMSRANIAKSFKQLQLMDSEISVNQKNADFIVASTANMDEKTYSQFISNYLSETSLNSFRAVAKDYLIERGVPADKIDSNLIDAMYCGVLPQLGLTLTKEQTEWINQQSTAESINVMRTVEAFNNAKTAHERAQTVILNEYGAKEADATIKNIKQDTANKKQQHDINNYLSTPTAQGIMLHGLTLDNLLKSSQSTLNNAKRDYTNYKGWLEGNTQGRFTPPISPFNLLRGNNIR